MPSFPPAWTTVIPFSSVFLKSAFKSVSTAAAWLIGRLLRYSHISSCLFDHIHWPPLLARIQLKVLVLIYRSSSGLAHKSPCDLIRPPTSAISLRPLRSLDRLELQR